MHGYSNDQAIAFETAYAQLKKAKRDECYLDRHRAEILAAEFDDICDADLIRTLKTSYPSIVVSRNTLKRVREKWKREGASNDQSARA